MNILYLNINFSRVKHMIKRIPGLLLLVMLFLLFAAKPVWAAAEPAIIGEAGVLMNYKNGQLLYEKNPHSRVYPASTTKILTAVVVMENASLNEMVVIPPEACNIEGSATGLQPGEVISLEDLIYALLLNSGNDTALALAIHVGGSTENFVRMMNKKAFELRAVNSHFNNPNGLPDPDHYSTAFDLALITRYAMQKPEFRKIVSTKVQIIHRDYPDAQTYLENHNRLLWTYEGAIGVKTGYTDEARQCLVSAADRNGRELIAVVMKSEGMNIWYDTKALLDYGFNQYVSVSLVEAGKFVGQVPVKFGVSDSVPIQTGWSAVYDFPSGQIPEITQEIVINENITAPVQAGEKLGQLIFKSGDLELGGVDLVAQQEVKRKILAQWWPWFLLVGFLYVIIAIMRYHRRARRKRLFAQRNKYYF